MESRTADFAYRHYAEWKGWDGDRPREASSEQFAMELARAEVPKGARIFEIGFGAGEFLDWARRSGFIAQGIERDQNLTAAARQRDHDVLVGELPLVAPSLSADFDTVVAFDVLEHLSREDIIRYFECFHHLLKPGGTVIARFPNVGSPFGLRMQYGDITHLTGISGNMIDQVGRMTGFELVYAGNSARSKTGGRHSGKRWQKEAAYAVRAILEVTLGFIYFGSRVALDPCMTTISRKV
jgi:2-polyprenyl-3-methyl-5-hydroxy-6-metoxy-1,4-benzoquinol methylase